MDSPLFSLSLRRGLLFWSIVCRVVTLVLFSMKYVLRCVREKKIWIHELTSEEVLGNQLNPEITNYEKTFTPTRTNYCEIIYINPNGRQVEGRRSITC